VGIPPVSTITIRWSTLTFFADTPGIYKDADLLSLFAIGETFRDSSIRVIVTIYCKSLAMFFDSGDVVSVISEEGMGSGVAILQWQTSAGFCALAKWHTLEQKKRNEANHIISSTCKDDIRICKQTFKFFKLYPTVSIIK